MNFASRRDASVCGMTTRVGFPDTGCDPSGIGFDASVTGGVATLNPRLIAGIPPG